MAWRLPQLLTCLLLLTLTQTAFEQPAQVATTNARLIEAYGDVQSRHAAGGYKAAKVGETLVPGDGLKTGANARAQLAIGTNQYVRLDQNSQVLITHVQQDGYTSFKTMVGGVWVTIQKAIGVPTKFEVETPSVVAGARGTIFRCEVQEDGETAVYVYEGEVDVTGAGEVVRVAPDRFARARQGVKPALADINTDEDERRDFVRYNRHCETLSGLGNPRVLVALSMVEGTKPQAAVAASDRLVEQLVRLGYSASAVKPEHLRDATYDNQGVLRVKPKLADYYLVGAIRVQAPRPTAGRPATGLATIRARLVAADDYHVVSTAQAQQQFTAPARGPFGLPNPQDRRAGLTALLELGDEVARQMAPQLMRDLVADRPAAVRVDIAGTPDPRQIRGLKSLLAAVQEGGRVVPLPRFDGGVSLLVTGVSPDEISRHCLAQGGQWLQSARAQGRIVQVTCRPGAAPE